MLALTFWKTVTIDQANFLDKLFSLLDEHQIRYCVIGGQGVNAYVEPVVSLDLDLVIAADQIDQVESLLQSGAFHVKRLAHSVNVSIPGSDIRLQIQTDSRYASFPQRATLHNVLGLMLPVATVQDILQGKIWAVQDSTRRASKRQKDLADIARLLEAYPEQRQRVPEDILARLL